jgi:hypothetical protein
MKRPLTGLAVLVALSGGAPALAQEPEPVYQTGDDFGAQLNGDGLSRQEWTKDPPSAQDDNRWRIQLRPRLELGRSKVVLGVGGDFNYSSDENTLLPPDVTALPLIRDNYDSRDARLDLAFLKLNPVSWLRIEGGRFLMPVALTEMTWDRDLRPQGGAVTLETRDHGSLKSASLTALGARGSHVFDDGDTTLWLFSGEATFTSGADGRISLIGSFLRFTDVGELQPLLRRQNTRVAGAIVREYEVVDAIVRLRGGGRVAAQVVGEYCWNTAADDSNRGLWLALALGSLRTARGRLDYTYAKVDKDATLAAYATDDFLWATGWEGHRADLGLRVSDHSSMHAIGQIQRFKDSARVEERDVWVKRLRVEMRISY